MIRTWQEEGSDRPFRAQIRIVTDLSSGPTSTVNVADRDGVIEAVQGFLEAWPAPFA
jgi:hypothetical protein